MYSDQSNLRRIHIKIWDVLTSINHIRQWTRIDKQLVKTVYKLLGVKSIKTSVYKPTTKQSVREN